MSKLKELFNRVDSTITADLSEEEAGELVKSWLRRHGPIILAGVIIALAVLFVMDWWSGRERRTAHEYSYQLETLSTQVASKAFDSAKQTYEGLAKDNGYSGNMAALLMAKAYADKGDNQAAMDILKKPVKSKDQTLANTARWQLANLQVSTKDYAGALGTLAELNDSTYGTVATILKGDIYILQGHLEQALQAYQQAKVSTSNHPFLDMKMDNLKVQLSLAASQGSKSP